MGAICALSIRWLGPTQYRQGGPKNDRLLCEVSNPHVEPRRAHSRSAAETGGLRPLECVISFDDRYLFAYFDHTLFF